MTTRTGASRGALRLTGLGAIALGVVGALVFVVDDGGFIPDAALMLFGFGGGGACMLARGFGSNRIAGAILLPVAIAGAAVFYADPGNPRDLFGAIVWLVGWAAGGVYLMFFRSETPP